MRWRSRAGTVGGASALAAAGLVMGSVLVDAVRGPDTTFRATDVVAAEPSVSAGPAGAGDATGAGSPPEEVPDRLLRLAADRAPFDAERAPSLPYLFPEERVPLRAPEAPRREPEPAPPFRVLGTVAAQGGGVAVIEAPGQAPRVLAMGDEVLGFRVSSIGEGRVELQDGQGRSVSVAVPEVAPRTAEAAARGRADANTREGGNTEVRGAAAAQAVNEVMRRMREQSGGDVRMELRGDRVILTAPDGTRREISLGGGGSFEAEVAPRAPAPATQRRPGGGG